MVEMLGNLTKWNTNRSKKMEQILQSTYLNSPDKWQTEANRLGGLEICDDDTGEPMYILEPHRIRRF